MYIPTVAGGVRLDEALESLANQTLATAVVVIDNGSPEASVSRLNRRDSDVRVVRCEANLGFGRAINQGVRVHPAERIILVNDDVVCDTRFVEALVDAAGDLVAGVLLQQERPGVIDSAGVVVDRTLAAFDHLHGEPAGRADTADAPLGPTGGAALIARDTFEAVGGFDPLIFAYLEDVDLAARLWSMGIRCRLAPGARALHHGSATLGCGSAAKNELMGFSRGYLLRRYGILTRPGTALRALVGEAVVCAGQLAIDRTASGVRGRAAGWSAARGLERREVPDRILELSLRQTLAWRLGRRKPSCA